MSDSENSEIEDLSDPNVTTKYQCAATIANKALEAVIAGCIDGADISSLCALGDKVIEDEAAKIYNKKEKGKMLTKGIAFPTCVSVNEICGHYSPFADESTNLKNGDIAKIDMAVHVDGYIASAGHTVLVGNDAVSDNKADVVQCAWTAAEAVLRLVRVGNKSSDVTKTIGKIGEEFGCNPVVGVYSHQVVRGSIDGGDNVIPGKAVPDQQVEEFDFEPNEAYSIDVSFSTGEGKGREADIRTTVYRRDEEAVYVLKTQKARQFFHEVNKRYPEMAFSLRSFEDKTLARVGVTECKRHELLRDYPVTKERGATIAQFKYTVLCLPGGSKKITGAGFTQAPLFQSSKSVQDEEIKNLLAQSSNPKKQKKKKIQTDKKAEAEAKNAK